MGIEQVKTAPHSSWQNPYCERVIGSTRRDCLNHIIAFNEKHLKSILSNYFKYYHHDRTHLGLSKDTPLMIFLQKDLNWEYFQCRQMNARDKVSTVGDQTDS